MRRWVGQLCVMVAVIAVAANPTGAGARELETSAEIIAAHIREQGYPCKQALNAQRDRARSRPNQQVWTLHCADRRYRVRLTPDMGSRVQRLQ
jgi:hypothetical protein